jgi:hypothetical protein
MPAHQLGERITVAGSRPANQLGIVRSEPASGATNIAHTSIVLPDARRVSSMTDPFDTVIEPAAGGGHAAAIPFDPKAAFGSARAPVVVTITGHAPFRTTVATYGGRGWIGLRKAQLTEMNLRAGDRITMLVEPDTGPREVELPAELANALAGDRKAAGVFDELSFSQRKEYAKWVAEAKRVNTRADRATKVIQQLNDRG